MKLRDELIINNMDLVKILAKIKKKKLTKISYEDLVSAGYLGLTRAAENYNEGISSFRTFASRKIQGAMCEYIEEFFHWGKSMPKGIVMLSLDEYLERNYSDSSLIYYDGNSFDDIICDLPEIGKQLLRWYYVEGLTYKQIGERFGGIGESWASQMMQKYRNMIKLRYKI